MLRCWPPACQGSPGTCLAWQGSVPREAGSLRTAQRRENGEISQRIEQALLTKHDIMKSSSALFSPEKSVAVFLAGCSLICGLDFDKRVHVGRSMINRKVLTSKAGKSLMLHTIRGLQCTVDPRVDD